MSFPRLPALFLSLTLAVSAFADQPAPTPAPATPTAKPYSAGIVVTPLMKTSVTGANQAIVYPQTDSPEVTAVMVEIPAGKQTGWHRHPVPCFAYVVQGAISVELEDGSIHEYKAGQAVPEVINLLHNGTNRGTESVKIVMFALGSKGSAFSVVAPAPARAATPEMK